MEWTTLCYRTIDKESHYNDDRERWEPNYSELDNPSRQWIKAEYIFEPWFSGEDSNYKQETLTLAMKAKARVKHSNQRAVPGFGKVYFDKDAIANSLWISWSKEKISEHLWFQQGRCFYHSLRGLRSLSSNVALRVIPIWGIQGLPERHASQVVQSWHK